ncbi:MAG: hypothetical protein MUO68_17175, partial [Desulfobacteraceae bacterium]|nr:hypothetical protein [Desulfobacteraceae bacterium]
KRGLPNTPACVGLSKNQSIYLHNIEPYFAFTSGLPQFQRGAIMDIALSHQHYINKSVLTFLLKSKFWIFEHNAIPFDSISVYTLQPLFPPLLHQFFVQHYTKRDSLEHVDIWEIK